MGGSSMLETLFLTLDVWMMWQKEEIPASWKLSVTDFDHKYIRSFFASFSKQVRHASQETDIMSPLLEENSNENTLYVQDAQK